MLSLIMGIVLQGLVINTLETSMAGAAVGCAVGGLYDTYNATVLGVLTEGTAPSKGTAIGAAVGAGAGAIVGCDEILFDDHEYDKQW